MVKEVHIFPVNNSIWKKILGNIPSAPGLNQFALHYQIYLVILKLATMQYILQYNHWQQISSTTNVLKHNTEIYHFGEKTELHTGQAAFVHGGSKKNRYLVILQYILKYNHWQQISSTTNVLKHNTEIYHFGEKTELHTGQAAFVHGGCKKTPIFSNVEARKQCSIYYNTTTGSKYQALLTSFRPNITLWCTTVEKRQLVNETTQGCVFLIFRPFIQFNCQCLSCRHVTCNTIKYYSYKK